MIRRRGSYYTAGYDTGLHFPEDLLSVSKFSPDRIYTAVLWDASQGFFYLKRFKAEPSEREQLFIDESEGSYLVHKEVPADPSEGMGDEPVAADDADQTQHADEQPVEQSLFGDGLE